jgi:hypothetical protein
MLNDESGREVWIHTSSSSAPPPVWAVEPVDVSEDEFGPSIFFSVSPISPSRWFVEFVLI